MAETQPEPKNSGPLSGLCVIELGSTIAGPFCTRLMSDFGADVIKVEQAEGDALRSMGRQCEGRSLYGASILRGKRAVSINLRTDEGRDLARRLCEKADIVVENFRPGTLEKWGLGYETLSAVNPGLVMVRISGFGQDGPYSDRGGYGVVCEAVSGLREINGEPDRPPPRMATSLTDYITGLYAAFGAVMAIFERTRSGRGQVVDAALYEGSFSFMEPHIPAFQQLGEIARRDGHRLPGNTPNSLYETRDARHIVIVAASNSVFARLAGAMGQPALAEDPCFVTALKRIENEDACDAAIETWTRSLDLAQVEQALKEAKVPAARIYTVEDIFADPHFRHRDMLLEVEDPVLGPVTLAGIVPKLSATPGKVRWSGREIGADTVDVLQKELNLTGAEVEALAHSGVVAGPDLPAGGDKP